MQVLLCRHIKTNGLQCRGVQLTGSNFCYFHRRLHRSHETYRNQVYFHPARIDHTTAIQLPAVEDRESAQLAISCVINALASGYINRKQANSLFYGLQLATTNARGLHIVRRPTQQVRDVEKESAGGLPETSPDLAPPGRTREIGDPIEVGEVEVEPLRSQSAPSSEAVILSEEHSDESKDPDTVRTTSTDRTIPPPNPSPNNPQPSADDDESATNATLFLTVVHAVSTNQALTDH